MNAADLIAGLATERTDDLAVELLIWLRERGAAIGSEVPLDDFLTDDHPRATQADEAARRLRSIGHITLEYTFGAALLGATAAGMVEADRVVQARRRVRPQFEFLLDELVRQAAETADATVCLRLFLTRTRFLGLPLRPQIVRRAARYLQGHGLALLLRPDGESEALRLTSRGEDCAVSTLTVRQYMNHQQQPAAAATFTQNVYGGAAAQGMSVTQNVGHPATETALLIDRLQALASEHGLSGTAFDGDVAVLQDVDQEQGRRVGAWHRIRAGLLQAAPALAGQAALAAIDQGLGRLGLSGQ
ncbi:hypothetical protein [Streptomyces sp. NPDC002587]